MEDLIDFSDQRHKAWCIHCGSVLRSVETSQDHVPSKCLLLKPYPPRLPTIPICRECNTSFSRDEGYFAAFLSAVLSGTTNPESQPLPAARRTFEKSPRLRTQIDRSRQEQLDLWGGSSVVWMPEHERILNVVVKNARGHAFFEYGEPMRDDPVNAWATPLAMMSEEQRAEFFSFDTFALWPEVGSRMFQRVTTGQDMEGHWVVVQDGVYRYALSQCGGTVVKAVIHEYLAAEVCWE